MIHGNIRKSSFMIMPSGELKLSGFEVASMVSEEGSLLPEASLILREMNSELWPPEVQHESWQAIRSFPVHAVDAWMLVKLLTELLGTLPPVLSSFCREALSREPYKRHSPAGLLEPSVFQRLFDCPLIQADRILGELPAADSEDRDRLFSRLQNLLPNLTAEFMSHKLVPACISLLEIQKSLDGLRLILAISSAADQETFTDSLELFIISLFALPDRALRLLLLENIEIIVEKMSEKCIQDSVFGHFVTGFTDAMPELREKTLKASVELLPKLTVRQINNELVRHYARLQADEQPGIRVNSIICLGRISSYFDPVLKRKVFVGSIGKALQDPFPPSRSAAMKTLLASLDAFPNEALAKHFLPLVCTMLIDSDPAVNEQAFSTTRLIIDRLEKCRTYPGTQVKSGVQSASPRSPTEEKLGIMSQAASEWGSWGLQSITTQVSKIQKKCSVSLIETESHTKPAVVRARPKSPEKFSKSASRVLPESRPTGPLKLGRASAAESFWDEDGNAEASSAEAQVSPTLMQSLTISNGWGDDECELDPWSSRT